MKACGAGSSEIFGSLKFSHGEPYSTVAGGGRGKRDQ